MKPIKLPVLNRQFFFLTIVLLISRTGFSQTDISKELRPRYYYYNTEVTTGSEMATPKIISLLKKDWLLIPAATYSTQPINGIDSIMNFTTLARCAELLVYRTEITNQLYRAFVKSNKANSLFMPDTARWEKQMDMPVYSMYYFQDAAYNEYPVLGVTRQSAMAFCKWFEDSLNRFFVSKGITDLKASVTLPSEPEWASIYTKTVIRELERKKHPWLKSYSASPAYLKLLYGEKGFLPNFGQFRDRRGSDMKLSTNPNKPNLPVAVKKSGFCGGLYGLAGNAAEWTRTSADSNLFNDKQYMFSTSGAVIKIENSSIKENMLTDYLVKKEVTSQYYCVKGGSWYDEVFYTQQAAIIFRKNTSSDCGVGFRPVIHLKKTSN